MQGHFSLRQIGIFCLVYVAATPVGPVRLVALLVLLLWSLAGVLPALVALSLSAVMKLTHPALAASAPFESVLLWLIAIFASASIYARARQFTPSFLLLLSFAVVALVTSMMVSPNVDVSVMKVLSFFVCSSAMLLSATALRPAEVAFLQRWYFGIALAVAAMSLLTVAFPGIAFTYRAGLQGVFSHPQMLGVFFAPFAAYFVAQVFLEKIRTLPWWVPGAAALFSALIIASGARTGVLATFLAVAVTLGIVVATGKGFRQSRSRQQVVGFTVTLSLLSLLVVVFGGLQEEIETFALKGDEDLSVEEAFEASRGAKASAQIENFIDAPLTGHGFGVYREGVLGGEARIKRFMGIPISASAEKGVAFTAVLEETGLVGGLLFYALLVSIVIVVTRGRDAALIAMALAAIFVNFGQAIIFSIGGMGQFMWLVLAFTMAKANVLSRVDASPGQSTAKVARRRRFSFVD